MFKNAVFSPCRDCCYHDYDKKYPYILLDADGHIVKFMPAEDRLSLTRRLKKFKIGQSVMKNPCPCQAAADYDDLVSLDYCPPPMNTNSPDPNRQSY